MSSDWCCSRQSTDWRSVNKLEFFKWKIRTCTKEEEQGRPAWNKSAHRSPRGLDSQSNATPCCGVWKDINGMSTGQWHHNSAIVNDDELDYFCRINLELFQTETGITETTHVLLSVTHPRGLRTGCRCLFSDWSCSRQSTGVVPDRVQASKKLHTFRFL